MKTIKPRDCVHRLKINVNKITYPTFPMPSPDESKFVSSGIPIYIINRHIIIPCFIKDVLTYLY